MESENQSPFYKKWWFLSAVAIVFIIGLIAGFSDGKESSKEKEEVIEKEKSKEKSEADKQVEINLKEEFYEGESIIEDEDEPAEEEVVEGELTEEDKLSLKRLNETAVEEDIPIEDEVDWSTVKNYDKIIGTSSENFEDLTISQPRDVNNDVTKKWSRINISADVDIVNYVFSYRNLYMGESEVHFIVNSNDKTTTWLMNIGGLLFVEVREYNDGDENSAKTIGRGQTLKKYTIYPDGEIEEVEMTL